MVTSRLSEQWERENPWRLPTVLSDLRGFLHRPCKPRTGLPNDLESRWLLSLLDHLSLNTVSEYPGNM